MPSNQDNEAGGLELRNLSSSSSSMAASGPEEQPNEGIQFKDDPSKAPGPDYHKWTKILLLFFVLAAIAEGGYIAWRETNTPGDSDDGCDLPPPPPTPKSTLQLVRERGYISCGITRQLGFSESASGSNTFVGFDAAIVSVFSCRAARFLSDDVLSCLTLFSLFHSFYFSRHLVLPVPCDSRSRFRHSR